MMNDFQDILKVFLEADESGDVEKLKRPNITNVERGVGGEDDAKQAILKWMEAQTQEWNVLKQQVHGAIALLKTVYDSLGEYDQTTAAQQAGVQARPDVAAAASAPDRQAQLAALRQQFQSKLRTPPAAGGTV